MKEKDELKLSRLLSDMQGEAEASFPWGKAKIQIRYLNYSAGGRGCPDSLLIVRLSMPVLGQNVSVEAPILVEAEKAGTNAAIEDLNKFCDRSIQGILEGGDSSFIEVPMLVATRYPLRKERKESRVLKVSFNVREVKL